MSKRLYVGSLPFDVSEEQLRALFTPCGQVESAKLITDKYSGQSKGFGFVEMTNDAEAQTAIQKLNGSDVGGRRIVVNEARPMGDRGTGPQARGPGQGGYGKKHKQGGFKRW